MEEILVYFALKYNGDFDLILKALEEKEYVEEEIASSAFFYNFAAEYD